MGLRILIASDHYPPYIGGAHRQTHLLSLELSRRGNTVNVATVWHPGLPTHAQEDELGVHRFKQLRNLVPGSNRKAGQRHHPPFPDPVTVLGLRRLLNSFQPDLIHSYGWISYSVALALRGKEIPLLISARDYSYSCATRSLLYRDQTCEGPALQKCLSCAAGFYGVPKGTVAVLGVALGRSLLMGKVGGLHSVSQYVEDVLQRDLMGGLQSGPTKLDEAQKARPASQQVLKRVIPSFLIPSSPSAGTEEFLNRLPAEPFILYVGGLQYRKGVWTLLEAYQKLDSPPPLVLIGYSSADMPSEYPPGVTVLQDVPHAHVMEAWDRCLFGVTPSVWPDPSPGVVREAMSRGKAVIVTRVGGSTEMIDEERNGLLVPPGDVDALARAMQRLNEDAALRQRLGESALAWSAQYMADVVVPQFEQFYHQLVELSDRSKGGEKVHAEVQRPYP